MTSPDESLLDLFEYALLVQRAKRSASWITRRKGRIQFLRQVPMREGCDTERGYFERRPELPHP